MSESYLLLLPCLNSLIHVVRCLDPTSYSFLCLSSLFDVFQCLGPTSYSGFFFGCFFFFASIHCFMLSDVWGLSLTPIFASIHCFMLSDVWGLSLTPIFASTHWLMLSDVWGLSHTPIFASTHCFMSFDVWVLPLTQNCCLNSLFHIVQMCGPLLCLFVRCEVRLMRSPRCRASHCLLRHHGWGNPLAFVFLAKEQASE